MDHLQIKYPIYIVSKGRFKNPLTAKIFMKEGIPFRVMVEPQEYEDYCRALGAKHILKTSFSNLGLGSFPARNAIWEHSISEGHSKHFIFDDNIRKFDRLNQGKRTACSAREALIALQEFTDRYSNVALSGFNYRYFVTKDTKSPFTVNCHVYSGMLIRNELNFRWRLKYNEDVDLCLQALSQGFCTILMHAFLIDKTSTTVMMKGGNQDELYKNNDSQKKMLKSRSLQKVWPQYVKVVERFGRPHHQISWKKHFKTPLKRIIHE